jgi:tetratricopeptide (TPR) repeat protein
VRFFTEERYFRAIDALKNALKLNPHYGDAYKYLAQVYYSSGDYSVSLDNALAALKYAHNDVDAMLMVANCYRELGENQKAEDYYKAIRKKFPAYGEVYRNLGELYLKMNRFPLSYKMIQKAIRYGKDSWRNYITFGDYYYALRNTHKAEANYLKAFNLNSRERDTFVKLADFYYKENKLSQAVSLLEKGNVLFENFISGVDLLGDSYLKQNEFDKAIKNYKWLEENDSEREKKSLAWLYYKMGLAYEESDKLKAEEYYTRALEIDPDNSFFYYSFERFAIKSYKIGHSLRKKLAKNHLTWADRFYGNGEALRNFLHLKRAVYLDPFLVKGREKLIKYYEANRDYYGAYNELKNLYKINRSYKTKDRIEKYEWDIEKKKLALGRQDIYEYKGLVLAEARFGGFANLYTGLVIYMSMYFDKFKFSTIGYRKIDGVNYILEYMRRNNLNFFVIVDLLDNDRVLKFEVYDRFGKRIGEKSFPYNKKDIEESLIFFYGWLNTLFPEIAYVKGGVSADNYRVSFGKSVGVQNGDELLVFDVERSLKEIALLKVKKSYNFHSECEVVSNFVVSAEKVGKKVIKKSENITKKHLTKIEKMLSY